LELFIAKRLAQNNTGSFSGAIIKIAIMAVGLSVCILILTASIVEGFQSQITEKIFGYWGHIQVLHLTADRAMQNVPIYNEPELIDAIRKEHGIKHAHVFANKAGILKTADNIEGVVLRGVSTDYNWSFFEEHIIEGGVLNLSDSVGHREILVSNSLAKRLKLKVGDNIVVFFAKDKSVNTLYRKLIVKGIYHTGLEEYDRLFCYVDIRHIQKLNGWDYNQISGVEIFINDVHQLDSTVTRIENALPYMYRAQSLKDVFPNIFDWVNLTVTNKYIVIILVTLVAAFNMITVLLILILERTKMVGILKTMGAMDWNVQKIFLYHAVLITLVGVLLGNVLGIGLSCLQITFGIVSLPEESYYLSTVPVQIDWWNVFWINIGAIITINLILIIPSIIIKKISPIKAIRFN